MTGWRTDRKIIVFESDDWGSIRMPSRIVFDKLRKLGLDLISGDSHIFNSYDTLAGADDLESLFETLNRFKDNNGNRTIFTALSVVANPAFTKIQESGFSEYFYEPFTETLRRYYGDDSVFRLWKLGIELGIFKPQFHGREHLNVPVWLKNLQKGDSETLLAFNNGIWGFNRKMSFSKKPKYQAAFDFIDRSDLDFHASVIIDGLTLFEELFGYRAQYFVPPNGLINNSLNRISAAEGIRFRSTSTIQYEPLKDGEYKKVFHFSGQRNSNGQIYFIRNSVFEPSSNQKDWVDSCLNDIKIAFSWKKPAIIGTHRVNYIGSLDPTNRDRNLKSLSNLLTSIVKKWPDVEFMSSDQLGNLIISKTSINKDLYKENEAC